MTNRLSKDAKLMEMINTQVRYASRFAFEKGMRFFRCKKKEGFVGYLIGEREGIVPLEVKVRSFPSDRFDTSLIEKLKIDKLKKHAAVYGHGSAWYAEAFTDDVMYVYDLTMLPLEWTVEEVNANTLDSRSVKKNKMIAFVQKEVWGTKYDLDPNSRIPIIRGEKVKIYQLF